MCDANLSRPIKRVESRVGVRSDPRAIARSLMVLYQQEKRRRKDVEDYAWNLKEHVDGFRNWFVGQTWVELRNSQSRACLGDACDVRIRDSKDREPVAACTRRAEDVLCDQTRPGTNGQSCWTIRGVTRRGTRPR